MTPVPASRFVLLAFILLLVSSVCIAYDEHSLINLALAAVRAEVSGKNLPTPTQKSPVRPVFVTLEKKGRVVGCRGGLEPRSRTLEEEIVLSARAAARHDPRYTPLSPKDLNDIKVTITIVSDLESIESVKSLLPSQGLVLRVGSRTGIVLPWEGKDPEVRLKWAYKKAGVSPGTACKLYRLKAERFRG